MKLIAKDDLQNAESQGGMGPEGLLEAGQCSCVMKWTGFSQSGKIRGKRGLIKDSRILFGAENWGHVCCQNIHVGEWSSWPD
jgi:hypothetical protein